MELWLILFILVIAISFFLAYQSMRDFQEGVQHAPQVHGIYLIKNPHGVTPQALNILHTNMARKQNLVSFETLFKGPKRAHVVFGPKEILEHALVDAQLVELEDYTQQVDLQTIHVWEMELKDSASFLQSESSELFSNMPQLAPHEHFWWQMVLKAAESGQQNSPWLTVLEKLTDPILNISYRVFGFPVKSDTNRMAWKQKSFSFQVRCMFSTPDLARRRVMGQILEKLNEEVILKTPKPLTSTQLFESYLQRSIPPIGQTTIYIHPEKVIELAGLRG